MSETESISEIAAVLDDLPEGAAIMVHGVSGEPVNVAFHTKCLDGVLGWALAGFGAPWNSEKVAKAIVVHGHSWAELEVAW